MNTVKLIQGKGDIRAFIEENQDYLKQMQTYKGQGPGEGSRVRETRRGGDAEDNRIMNRWNIHLTQHKIQKHIKRMPSSKHAASKKACEIFKFYHYDMPTPDEKYP